MGTVTRAEPGTRLVKLFKLLKRLAAAAGICTAIISAADVLQPFAPVAWIVFGGSIFGLMVIWWLVARFPITKPHLINVALALTILATISIGLKAAQLVLPEANRIGVLATKSKNVRDLQTVLAGIEKRLGNVEQGVARVEISTHEINRKADRIDQSTQRIEQTGQAVDQRTQKIEQQVTTVKRETSEDPRKELANRGIAWTSQRFKEALRFEDFETVTLFLSGGFDWTKMDAPLAIPGYLKKIENPQLLSLFVQQSGRMSTAFCLPLIEALRKSDDHFWCSVNMLGDFLPVMSQLGLEKSEELCGRGIAEGVRACKKVIDQNIAVTCKQGTSSAECLRSVSGSERYHLDRALKHKDSVDAFVRLIK